MSYEDEQDCPGCGQYDHGFDMSDVRSNLNISTCEGSEECEENGCECEGITIKVTIKRIYDVDCNFCDGIDYRCVFDLSVDGAVIKRFASKDLADSYVSKVFPTAEAPERDYAWESEAGLRRAEGWGC